MYPGSSCVCLCVYVTVGIKGSETQKEKTVCIGYALALNQSDDDVICNTILHRISLRQIKGYKHVDNNDRYDKQILWFSKKIKI